jgi:hypothetical protein
LELCAVQINSLLEAVQVSKLNVAETLWPSLDFVFDNADAGDFAAVEELLNVD